MYNFGRFAGFFEQRLFFPFFVVFQRTSCNVTVLPCIDQFGSSVVFLICFDFGSYRARMQRRGHGCSAEGTRDGRTTSQPIRSFVATALSNVRRDGVI